MSTYEFISVLVDALAWPIVILIITLVFRKTIVKLCSSLNRLTYNNLEMEFTHQLEKIESSLETKVPPAGDMQSTKGEEIRDIAQISPSASIAMAWAIVEQEIMSTIKRLSISPDYPPYNSPLKNIQLLEDNGLIDSETKNTFNELRKIRNDTVHGHISDEWITYFDALKYYDLSKKVIRLLRKLER